MFKVFVYGTLMIGLRNHHYLKGARFIGKGTMQGQLWHLAVGYPAVVNGKGLVYGELYSHVSPKMLTRLDRLEDYHDVDCPSNLYERIEAQIQLGKQTERAFVYIMLPEKLAIITAKTLVLTGDWRSYINN